MLSYAVTVTGINQDADGHVEAQLRSRDVSVAGHGPHIALTLVFDRDSADWKSFNWGDTILLQMAKD